MSHHEFFRGDVRAEAALASPFVPRLLLPSCCCPESYVGEGYQGRVLLNVELVQRQLVHERLHQVVCGEVEDQAEKNGDGQSGERFLEDGEEKQRQTQTLREETDKAAS